MRNGIILQARMGSSRLPSKVLMGLPKGKVVMGEILTRCQLSKVSNIIVATSIQEENDILESYVTNNFKGVAVFRGSENNVLERYFLAAKQYDLEQIVRLTGDNPCVDYQIIDSVLDNHLAKDADYSYSKGYPLGMNVEVVSMAALQRIIEAATAAAEKEHVTAYIHKYPAEFNINLIYAEENLSDWRLTMDTPQDFALLSILYEELSEANRTFGLTDLRKFILERPYLLQVNSNIIQKKIFGSKDAEMTAAIELLSNLDFNRAAAELRNIHEKV